MALKSLFKKPKKDDPPSPWRPAGPYPALFSDVVVEEGPGVFALWHLGVRPQWVYIGGATDLSAAIEAARQDPDLLAYDQNGGVFMAWASADPVTQPGAVLFLRSRLLPAIEQSPLDALCPIPEGTQPIEVTAPEERLPEVK